MRILYVVLMLTGVKFGAFAQGGLLFEPDTAFLDLNNVNLQDTLPIFGADIEVTWQGDTSIAMSWRRINSECQDGWEFIVGDKNITLPPISSQASVIPLMMEPGEQSYLRVEVVHNTMDGCCTVGIEFSEDGGEVIDTCYFVFRLNSDCSGTSSVGYRPAFSELQIYPNPVTDVLTIRGVRHLGSVNVCDIMGNSLLRSNGDQMDVGGMLPGIYYLQISTVYGDVVTRPFIKT